LGEVYFSAAVKPPGKRGGGAGRLRGDRWGKTKKLMDGPQLPKAGGGGTVFNLGGPWDFGGPLGKKGGRGGPQPQIGPPPSYTGVGGGPRGFLCRRGN